MFGFRMVKSSVFEWLDHSKTDLQNVRFSNGFGIRMFGIRAPTVFKSIVPDHATGTAVVPLHQVEALVIEVHLVTAVTNVVHRRVDQAMPKDV